MINSVFDGLDQAPSYEDDTCFRNECGPNEPAIEQFYTDTDEEYNVTNIEECEESESMDDENCSSDEESEVEIDMDEGENSASGSDMEKPEFLNVVQNVKGIFF